MSSPSPDLTPEQAGVQLQALLNGPAAPPPPGVLPNFKNPTNLDDFVTLTIALCVILGTVSVALRMYTKKYIIRSLAYEDYVILIAWIGQVGETVPSGIVTRYGGGRHMWDIQLKTFFSMLYWVNISAIVYGFVIFFVKLSILLQYLRIFAPTKKGNMFMWVGAQLCIWAILIFYLIESVFEICICTPRKKIWNPLMEGGHCFSAYGTFQATGIFNAISDFAILILPMPCVWKLQLPLKRKFLMTAIFGTGLFACISSVLRTYYTWRIVQSPDVSYYMVPMGMWTYAELSTGVFISCLPVMPKFFQHVGPKVSKTLNFRSISTKASASGTKDEPQLLATTNQKYTAASADGKCLSHPEEYDVLGDDMSETSRNRSDQWNPLPEAKFTSNGHDLENANFGNQRLGNQHSTWDDTTMELQPSIRTKAMDSKTRTKSRSGA